MADSFVKNAADAKQVKEGALKEKFGRRQELEDLRAILDTEYGRRFVWRYLVRAGIFQSSFTGDSGTFFNEGRRDMGCWLLAEVNDAKPEAYLRMVQEANRREDPTAPEKKDGAEKDEVEA